MNRLVCSGSVGLCEHNVCLGGLEIGKLCL